jgi:hypothetical protein
VGPRRHVDGDDGRRSVGPGRPAVGRAAGDLEVAKGRIGQVDGVCGAMREIEDDELLQPGFGGNGERPAGIHRCPPAAADLPEGAAHVARCRHQGACAALGPEVPEAGPVREPGEPAVGQELGLQDRLAAGGTGDAVLLAEAAVRGNLRRHQPGRIPGHVRVVPDEPGEPPAIRREARVAEEVVAGGEGQRVAAVERHGHQPVLGLAVRPVLLEDGHHPVPRAVDQRLREAQRPLRRRADRPAAAIGIEAPEPLVLVVDQHDRAGLRREAGAAVFVQPGADVDRGGGALDGGARARRIEAQKGDPAALVGPALEQQQSVAVEGDLAESVLLAGDGGRADRRRPAAIGALRASKGQGQHLVG